MRILKLKFSKVGTSFRKQSKSYLCNFVFSSLKLIGEAEALFLRLAGVSVSSGLRRKPHEKEFRKE
jgi:hypothetical protein